MFRQKDSEDGLIVRRGLALAARLVLFLVVCLPPAWAQSSPNEFSFAVMGDTRGHYYLPGGQGQEAAIQAMLADRTNPQPVKLYFDQASGQLARAVFATTAKRPRYEIFYQEGWPWLIRRQINGQMRVVMRDAGRRWVFDRVVESFNRAGVPEMDRSALVIHTGDAVVWGGQGKDLDHNPYWQRFNKDFISRLPPTAGAGLSGRLFLALGNHDIRYDPDIKGVLSSLPYLQKVGLSAQNRCYSFKFQGCRFIFLDTGTSSKKGYWAGCRPDFADQMRQLTDWLNTALIEKARHVFVAFHAPSFCQIGHGGLPPNLNPHQTLKKFSDKLRITVFNGHVHTTELYSVDGVRYWVLGGSGAPQVLESPSPKPGDPPELYWAGRPRQEEYNYLMVKVRGPRLQTWLHRFRPEEPKAPFGRAAFSVTP